ncbi:MAG: cupin domain-containing protein [Acidimicrobiales bacterium]|jgi:quercetin dioxygenase-like cupin family protein
MGLHIIGSELGEGSNVLQTANGSMVTKAVYGAECSLMVATREAGYHSRPHRHMSEQINYVAEGEIWVFIDDKAFLAQMGDFYRIPANSVHWGWNRGDGPVTTFQAFAPPLDPYTRLNSQGLLEDGEPELALYHLTTRIDEEGQRPYLAFEASWFASLEEDQRVNGSAGAR